MANILIASADPWRAERWKAALASEHRVIPLPGLRNIGWHLSQTHAVVAVIDAAMLETDQSVLPELTQPPLKVLIVGDHWTDRQQIEAFLSGCSGYCDHAAGTALLLKAVNRLIVGDIWIQRHLVPDVIKAFSELHPHRHSRPLPNDDGNGKKLERLSLRELEVANLIKTGESNKKIASRLNISERTVKAHLTSIFNKLEIRDRLHLALFLKETVSE